MFTKLAAFGVNLAGFASLSAVAAHWTVHDWPAEGPVLASALAADALAPLPGPDAMAAMFGEATATAIAAGPAPAMTLTGIVVSGEGRHQAVFRPAQGAPVAAGVGESLPGGYIVKTIAADGVALTRDGRELRFTLPAVSDGASHRHDPDAALPVIDGNGIASNPQS